MNTEVKRWCTAGLVGWIFAFPTLKASEPDLPKTQTYSYSMLDKMSTWRYLGHAEGQVYYADQSSPVRSKAEGQTVWVSGIKIKHQDGLSLIGIFAVDEKDCRAQRGIIVLVGGSFSDGTPIHEPQVGAFDFKDLNDVPSLMAFKVCGLGQEK